MSRNALTIVIDYRIYAYLFQPIVAKLVERKIPVHVFCPSSIKDMVERDLGQGNLIDIHSLDETKKRFINRWRLHRALQSLFTRPDFSFQYTKVSTQQVKRYHGPKGFLLKAAKYVPKVPNRKINSFLSRVSGIGLRNPFPSEKILVGSLNASAELLSAKNQKIYTVMESWDHPVKTPNGYRSHRVYTWNRSLGEDWETTQGDQDWKPFYPLKLRYAQQAIRQNNLWERSRGKREKPMCVYAVASTRQFCHSVICSVEDRMISDLVIATKEAGWDLFIKPRPNGMKGEFNHFAHGNPHVIIGSLADDQSDQPANYFLDDDYNQRRFMEVIEADLVINAFTTFGLDAATAGIPVLQLDLRKAQGYTDSELIYNNYHIKKYLLGAPHVFAVENASFLEEITKFLRAPTHIAHDYRDHLVQWLFPACTMDEALDALVDDLIGTPSK